MKIYLAAAFDQGDTMAGVRDFLEAIGHEVTSRWIDVALRGFGPLDHEVLGESPAIGVAYAQADLEDIDSAEVVVLFTGTDSTSGGYHTELGYALGRRKKVAIVGPRRNVFHCVPEIMHYPSWPAWALALSEVYWKRVEAHA